ncbi:hypothetical protein B5022_21485, partial [Salmonella enterica subsp. enterica serovar Dublin]
YAPVKAKLKGQIWWLCSSKPVTLVQRVAALRTFEKPPCWAVFSFTDKTTFRIVRSQDNHA